MEWDERIPLQEIELNSQERTLLEAIENKVPYATDKTFEAAKRLRRFGLAIMQPSKTNETDVALSSIGMAYLIIITEKGHDYLSYVRNREADKKADRSHNWKVAIFSALAGALLSEPVWAILRWVFLR